MDEPRSVIIHSMSSTFTLSNLIFILLLWVGYRIALALYNISPLHPLSHFPGPKIAAVSYLYEAYHDWWRGGRYSKVIARMHEKYGPLVRINPDELHCSDPAFTDEIYAGPGRVRDKWQHQIDAAGAGPASAAFFSIANHDLHRTRRAPFSKFFSRQQMLSLEGEVQKFARMAADKMLIYAGKGAFDVKQAFNCFTADIISQYCFGEPLGFITQEGWEPNFATWVRPFIRKAYMMRHNAIFRKMTQGLPFIANYMGEDVKSFMTMMNVTVPGYVEAALRNPTNKRVFAEVIGSSKTLTDEEKNRFNGEGFVLLGAGTETTAAVLTVFTYWLLEKPSIYERLMLDLASAELNLQNMKWVDLEKCHYFWAILQECLRMTPGISHRSARRAPEEELQYRSADGESQWIIPRNTPIGMTSIINHWNVELFPNPDEFKPERWLLEDGQPNYQLQRRLIAFGKGSRGCIGENLALSELYIMGALMAFEIIPRARLVDTTTDDIVYDHDGITPHPKNGSISARIAID